MKEDFEDNLKGIVDNHNEIVDQAALWAGIEAKLSKKRRKLAFIWIPVLLLSIAIFGLLISNTTKNSDISVFQPTENLVNKSNAESVSVSNKSSEENHSISSKLNTGDINTNLGFSDESKNKSEISESKPSFPTSIKPQAKNTHKVNSNKHQVNRKQTLERTLPMQRNKKSSNQENQVHEKIVYSEVDIKTESHSFDLATKNETLQENFTELESHQLLNTIDISELQTERSIPLIKMSMLITDISKYHLNPEKENNALLQYFKSLSLSSTYFRGSKSIQNVSNTSYLNIRNSTEKFLDLYAISIKMELLQWNGLSLKSGVNYNYFTDAFEWKGDIFKNEVRSYTESNLYTLQGDIIKNSTSAETIVRYEKHVKNYNEQHFIDLPIELAYQYKIKNISLEAYSALNLSYKLGSNQTYLTEDSKIGNQLLASKWLNPNFTIGGKIEYCLNDQYSVGLHIEKRAFDIGYFGVENGYDMWGIGIQLSKQIRP